MFSKILVMLFSKTRTHWPKVDAYLVSKITIPVCVCVCVCFHPRLLNKSCEKNLNIINQTSPTGFQFDTYF